MIAEYEPIMKKLIKTVVRTFYEPYHAIICDILLESILLTDTEFCDKMKLLSREFNKLVIKLKEERLIKTEIKMETREDNKQYLKNVYFFDFAEVKDIVKYKIFKMTKALETKKIGEEEAFLCKNCDKKFSALDAQACISNYVFKCIFCKNDLIENVRESNGEELGLKELLKSLDEIIILLKEADKFNIPTMDYFQVLEIKKEKESAGKVESLAHAENPTPDSFLAENSAKVEDFGEVVMAKKESQFVKQDLPVIKQNSLIIEQDQILTVNGIQKKYSEVSETDLDLMNGDEYSLYYEIHQKYNQE
jgi:transcription initiation factor TFIIE subunit alpha